VRLLKKIGRQLPQPKRWSNGLIQHIELLVSLTQAKDWTNGQPIVWMSVAQTAERLGISSGQTATAVPAETLCDELTEKLCLSGFVSKLPVELQESLPDKPNWRDMAELAYELCHKMGISPSAWVNARRILGPEATSLSIILIFCRWQTGIVYKPGGYLRGMVRKSQTGDLHLMPSIFGLMDRADDML